jgi:hypothetical protein
MSSKTIYEAYNYIITFPNLKKWYYGARKCQGTTEQQLEDLSIYLSSSKKINLLIKYGAKYEIYVYKSFFDVDEAFDYEARFLKTAGKIKRIRKKMFNGLFGGLGKHGCSCPNKGIKIGYDADWEIVRYKGETPYYVKYTKSEFLLHRLSLVDWVCKTLYPVECYSPEIGDSLFSGRGSSNSQTKRNSLISTKYFPKEVKDLYKKFSYDLEKLREIEKFLNFQIINIDEVIRFYSNKKLLGIMEILGLKGTADRIKNLIFLKYIELNSKKERSKEIIILRFKGKTTLKGIGKHFGFSESRASQLFSSLRHPSDYHFLNIDIPLPEKKTYQVLNDGYTKRYTPKPLPEFLL